MQRAEVKGSWLEGLHAADPSSMSRASSSGMIPKSVGAADDTQGAWSECKTRATTRAPEQRIDREAQRCTLGTYRLMPYVRNTVLYQYRDVVTDEHYSITQINNMNSIDILHFTPHLIPAIIHCFTPPIHTNNPIVKIVIINREGKENPPSSSIRKHLPKAEVWQ